MTMYLDNRTNPIEFQGHRLKVKVIFFVSGPKFTKLFTLNVNVEKLFVFRMSIARSVPESSLSLSLCLSCSMGTMPVGVHDIFHEMGPFLPVHRQSVQSADVLVAPVC